MNFYRNSVAIVTGAGSGIGLALSSQLSDKGARVVLTDVHEDPVRKASETLNQRGFQSGWAALDVTDRAAFKKVVDDTLAEQGRIDYLFNNAGIGVGGEAHRFSYEDWKNVIDVNLFGVINGVTAVYPLMVERGYGHIVNVASVAGLAPAAGEISYTASKYAVVGLSHSLRAEGADLGVKVTVVCPGIIDTPIYDTSKIIGFDREKVLKLWPKGVTAEQCASEILAGVERNDSTIVITKFAKMLWLLNRASPDLAIEMSKRFLRRARQFRTAD